MEKVYYKKVKIKQFKFLWLIFMLLFFMPASYIIGGTISSIVNYLLVGVCLIMLLFAFYFERFGYRMKKTARWIILLYFWCIFGSSTVNFLIGNEIDVLSTIAGITTAISFVIVCDFGIWYSPKKTIECFLIVGIIMCSINAISILLLRDSGGMLDVVVNQYGGRMSRNYYFLGEDNATYFWSWPVLVVTWLYYYLLNHHKYMKTICYAYTTILIISYVYVWSVLSFIACISVPLVLLILKKDLNRIKRKKERKKKEYVSFNIMWISGLAFNILLSVGMIISYFAPVIQGILQKDVTLSRRTLIWERSYVAIKSALLTGYGFEPTAVSYAKITINHTHNLFVETLYRGGVIGIILLCISYLMLSIDANTTRGNIINRYLKIMILFFIIYSSMYFAFYRYHYLILFILLSRLDIITKSEEAINK